MTDLFHTGVAKLCRRVVASASPLGLTLVEAAGGAAASGSGSSNAGYS